MLTLFTTLSSNQNKGPILENDITVGDITLSPGNWEVYWYADLDTVGTDPLNPNNNGSGNVTTRHSTLTNFRVIGKYYGHLHIRTGIVQPASYITPSLSPQSIIST